MTQRTQETQPEPQSQSQDGIDRRLLPWSHRLPVWARFLVDLLAGAVVGVIGTMAHRMGASANTSLRSCDRICSGHHLDMVGAFT